MSEFDLAMGDAAEMLSDEFGDSTTYIDPESAAQTALTGVIWCGSRASEREANDGTADERRQTVKVPRTAAVTPAKRAVLVRGSDRWTVETVDDVPGGFWACRCVRADRVESHRPGRYLRQ